MSTRKVIASFAVELTEDERGYLSITATRRVPSVDYFAPPVTATYLGILETIQKLSTELLCISKSHRRSRF